MSSDNIKVVVRARPFKKCNIQFVPWVIDNKKIHQTDEDNTPIGDTYSYDEVFNIDTKNVDIYDTAIASLVRSAIDGINLTIFAYGATSSGKTFTMNGIPEDPGIIPRFIEDIFSQVESYCQRKFLIRVSYVEIYSEIINDLLDKTNKDLKIREDVYNTVSYNPKEIIVKSSGECMDAMKYGTGNRTVGETSMNLFSSRSHSIFRIVIESAPSTSDENDPVQVSHVNLIDLAGSERVSQTGATGQRFKEGAHINKSLTALGLVIKQLVEKKEYVNYRDSKLTRILSNALGGNAKTLIICNINLESLEDTASTLMFAQRAKAVKNKPKVNEIMTEAALTKRYAKECSEVKKLLDVEFEKNKQLEDEREMSNKKITELASRIKSLQEIFVKKETLPRPPKRRHTFCVLGAISEERELENASKNLLSIGLRPEANDSRSSGFDNSDRSPRRSSCSNSMDGQKLVDVTPPKNLRARLEILTREHEELIEYTRTEKSESHALATKCGQLANECQDLKMLVEVKDEQLKSEQRNAEQIRIDYEFMLETQTKKFKRRELELLEQIKGSSKPPEAEAPISIENLPLPNTFPINTFEYEEMSEKMALLKQQNEELLKTTQSVKLENEDLNRLIADLRNSVNTLELQKSQLKIKTKSLQTKIVDMEVKVNNSQHDVDTSNNDVDSLMKKIRELEKNMEELKTESVKLKEELYESQDKLIEVTEDLDIEENKKTCLEKQLSEEKELRQEAESKLLELKKEVESKTTEEKDLLQLTESDLQKERKLRQESDSRLVEEKELRVVAESKLANSKLIQEMEFGQESASSSADKISLGQEMELNLAKEIELRQKAQMELAKQMEISQETKRKLVEEVELRQEIMRNLCTLKSILEQKSQQNDLSTQVQRSPIESVYDSPEDSKITESYLDMSDALKSLNNTGESSYESIQEIDSENLENFSSSYFQDSSKCNNFMNFFNSFINNDSEVSKSKENESEQKGTKYESNMNEIEELQKDLNMVKMQRESDIVTIKKLQEQLDEYNYMNLSDSQKINKTHKILGALKLLEAEKAENLSLIQQLKEQRENDVVNYQQLENNFKITNVELKEKKEEIQLLLTNIEKLNEEINSQTDKSDKKNIEFHDIEQDEKYEKINSEKEMDGLHSENNILNMQIEKQKTEHGRYLESLKEREKDLQNLAEENGTLRERLEAEGFKLKQEKEANNNNSIQIDLLTKQVEKMNISIQEKDAIIQKLNENKSAKNNLELLNSPSFMLQNRHDDEGTNSQIGFNKNEMTERQPKENQTISNLNKEKVDLSNEIEELKKEMGNLSKSVQNKEEIIACIKSEKIDLEMEKNDLSNKINDLMIQIQTTTNNLEQHNKIVERIEIITEENVVLQREQENTNSILTQERKRNVNLSNDIEKHEIESKELHSLLEEKEIIISEMKTEKTNLQEERNQLMIAINDKDEIIANFTLEKTNLEREMKDLSGKMNDLIIQVQTQSKCLEEQNDIINSKEINFQKISEENEMLKKDQESTGSLLKEQEEKIINLSNDIESIQIELKKSLEILKEKELIILEMNTDKTNLQQEKNDLSIKISDLLMQIGQEKKNEIILNEDKERITDLLNNIGKMQSEVENMSIAIRDKDKIIASLNLEKTYLEREKSDLSGKMNELIVQVQTQTSHIQEQNDIMKSKEIDFRKIAGENEMFRKEQESTDSIIKHQEKKITNLSNDIENLQIEFKNTLTILEEKEMIILEMNTDKTNLEKEINNLSIKICDLLMQIEQQEKNEIVLNEDREKIADLLNNMGKLQSEVENMSIAIRDKDRIISSFYSEKTDLERENRNLSDKLNDLMNQVKTQTDHFKEQNDMIKSKEINFQKIAEENEVLRKKLKQINSTLKEREEKNAELSNDIIKLKIESKKLVSSLQEKEIIIAEMNTLKIKLEEEKNTLSIKINDLLLKTDEQKKNETISEQEWEDLKKNNSDLLENLFALTSINNNLEEKMQDLRAEFSEKLGSHIDKLKLLFGIEEVKNWKFWEQQKKLETKWEELKKIENLVSTLVKEKQMYADCKIKLENAERINRKLISEREIQQEQTKFLQMTVEKVKKECEISIADNEKKLQSANTKLKTVYMAHEQDKKRIENMEYELRTMSKKLRPVGNSNHNCERDVSDFKNPDDKWKQQRTRAHDSRRSIDLNTLCSESTVDTCQNCENMNKTVQKLKLEITQLKLEISQLKDEIQTQQNKYGLMKSLCRLRNEENQKLIKKSEKYTND